MGTDDNANDPGEDDSNDGLALAGVGVYVGMVIYSVMDADREARDFNRSRHLGQRLRLEPLALHRGAGAQVRRRF